MSDGLSKKQGRFCLHYGVGDGATDGVSAEVGATDAAGVGAIVGVGVTDELLNVILGLLLLVSVRPNESVVSCTLRTTVPATCEVTVKLPWPFCVVMVAGRLCPFTCVLLSPELNEIFMVEEDETALMLQSLIVTDKLALPLVAAIGDAG